MISDEMPRRSDIPKFLFLALFVLAGGCDSTTTDEEPPLPSGPLFTVLGETSNFDTFPEATARAGMGSSIGGGGSATFFVPDDEAFHLMAPETLDGLANQQGVLRSVLLRHVVQGSVSLESLNNGDVLQTVEGTPLTVTVDDEGTVFLDGARIEERIGETDRGPVYRVKEVFRNHLTIEVRVAASPLLEHASRLFEAAGINLTQQGTFLIPIDPGFEQYPGDGLPGFDDPDNRPILRRMLHNLVIPDYEFSSSELVTEQVVPTQVGDALLFVETDGVVTLNSDAAAFTGEDVPLLVRDLQASNGVFHLIERPLQGHLTLWEAIDLLGGLRPFAAMLEAGGMQETLHEQAGLTVFAPLQAAFDSLRPRGVNQLLNADDAALSQLLAEYHVSPTDVSSSEFEEGDEGNQFPSLAGQSIHVRSHWVNGETSLSMAIPSEVLDIPARNGRMHFVQSLLNPSTPTAGGVLFSTLDPFDQLLLSGSASFRAVVRNTGYEAFVRGPDPVSILAPLRIRGEYLQTGFECRAIQLVEDHIAPGGQPIRDNPMIMLNDHQVIFLDPNHSGPGGPPPIPATLFEPGADPNPQLSQPLGESPWYYDNFRLENGSYIHGVVEQMRWHGNGPEHEPPPPCSAGFSSVR